MRPTSEETRIEMLESDGTGKSVKGKNIQASFAKAYDRSSIHFCQTYLRSRDVAKASSRGHSLLFLEDFVILEMTKEQNKKPAS